jgi:flagellar FliL protein
MADAHEPKQGGSASGSSGGLKAWLPLLVAVLVMPALAYVTTTFVLVPRLKESLGLTTISAREPDAHAPEPGAAAGPAAREAGKLRGPKFKVALNKIIVNVSGTMGTRLMCASFTLAGNSSDFKATVEENTDQLRDIAASVLGSKTITDLEKPEARNLIRAELLSQFNAVLGGAVQEIYITEFAIQ